VIPQPRPALFEALDRFARALPSLGHPVMLIGGLAVIARGVPRHTIDIDATIDGEGVDLNRVLATLHEFGIVPRMPEVLEFARQRQVLLLRDSQTGTGIDLTIGWLPFEHEAIARATPVNFEGTIVPVASLPDLIVLKAVAWRDRDRTDLERLIARHHRSLDLRAIRSTVSGFYGLLDEPERIAEFDELVRKSVEQAD
jgi:hypothetical protein